MAVVLKAEVYRDGYNDTEQNFTEAEYLLMDQHTDKKLEFIDGKIYAMSNGSRSHGIILSNLDRLFYLHLENNPCDVYRDTLKIKRDENYFIPDLIVDCEDGQNSNFSQQPILIIEVLSPATRNNDLGIKFEYYQQIETLQEYVIIEQDSMCIDIYRRQDNWEGEKYLQNSQVEFKSINLTMPIEDIYKRVHFNRTIRKYHGLKIVQ